MACKSCHSDNQILLRAEINIHFPGEIGLNVPGPLVYPELLVCLNCGFTEFSIPKAELHLVADTLGRPTERK